VTDKFEGTLPPRTVDAIIATVSWEPRFLLGFVRLLRRRHVRKVLFLRYREWARWSNRSLAEAENECKQREIAYSTVDLPYFDAVQSWRRLRDAVDDRFAGKEVIVDVTTAPREGTWHLLAALDRCHAVVYFAYHKPQSYSDEWLSRDPERPRLVLQQSGEPEFGRPTVLLAMTGYDVHRTEQVIRTFEPSEILLGQQVGQQFNNDQQKRNHMEHLRRAMAGWKVTTFDVDAYASDTGLSDMTAAISPHLGKANIIATSLGPKLSALGAFALRRRYPEIGLAYAPTREFNFNYSDGIATSYVGLMPGADDDAAT
jgi:hypothetical protein